MQHSKPIDPPSEAEVRAYIADDPDPEDRAELAALLASGDAAELAARFAGPLEFGTAGLRAEMGAGPARMNRRNVARATYGLCQHLRTLRPDAAARGLCVGYDARHRSRALAEETAAVAAGAGFDVHLFERPAPTPLLAFAVLDRGAAGGVMITASHNPKRDNGYKVYLHNGAQLIPPHDRAVAQAMNALEAVAALPRRDARARRAAGLQHALGDALERRYLQAIAQALPAQAPTRLRVAYTALHGVGQRLLLAALSHAGFDDVHAVSEQAQPDPEFPTVAFPNPEEPHAMDRVLALGQTLEADLALANDPDADRLAAAARDAAGTLRALSGNELGVLLADHLLSATPSEPTAPPALVVSSIVSTPMVAAVARAHGAHHELTLTGFKWICTRALELEQRTGARFVFGFEEALGYCTGRIVRDKDGISAAVALCQLAASLSERGQTLFDRLEALWRVHGLYASSQLSLRLPGADGRERREALMRRIRSQPPASLAGLRVVRVRDLARGEGALPPSDLLLIELEHAQRVAVRPSGTEPKLKFYLDAREPLAPGEPLEHARGRARARLQALSDDLRAFCDEP